MKPEPSIRSPPAQTPTARDYALHTENWQLSHSESPPLEHIFFSLVSPNAGYTHPPKRRPGGAYGMRADFAHATWHRPAVTPRLLLLQPADYRSQQHQPDDR
jgi:hypothetical protein